MSIITLPRSGLQLVLHDSNHHSPAPKQRNTSTNLEALIQQLYFLRLFADFDKPIGRYENKPHEVALKVQDEALPMPSRGEVSAATRHWSKEANGARAARHGRHCHWLFLHRFTLECHGSEPPSFGYKRVGSPSSGNQSGEKKQRPDEEHNDGKNNRVQKQSPGKKKRGFGPQQPFIKKLACLFYKLDPQEYQCCVGYSLTKWDHVLQHVKRRHLVKGEHCPDCREEFEGEFAEAEKNEHILLGTCEKKTALETGLLLEEEYNDLTGLHGSHEEKWFKAWVKLFGEHPAPYSPFIETLESMLEAQYSTLERELPSLLQSFLRDSMSRPEGDSTSATTNAILRLIRNPIPSSSPPGQRESQSVLALSTLGQSLGAQDLPPNRDPDPLPNIREPSGPIIGASYDHLHISPMETAPFASQDINVDELLWPQPFEDSSTLDSVLFGEDEYFDQWINYLDEGQYFE
ncbi:hypothetical protein FPHYL_9884 [Fusarium phyllophilum]|uniref:C2H2-type domain-containing protein n=1 Tax=Fusarium phyllophilum TaxID=47803 RepID=A0A8H5J6J4_9HYPO|nr:hypothetical protein FPHYL_9884 [Fusarium phyllophilum]